MPRCKTTLLILVASMLVATTSVAGTIDLTTYGQMTEQARVARYTNFIGSSPNQTSGYDNNDGYTTGIGNPYLGAYDYVAEPGQNGFTRWYRLADGNFVDFVDSYQRTASTTTSIDEWVGYRFKRTASVTSIVYADRATYDGGIFDAAPSVQVLDKPMEQGGVWTTVASSWGSTPYNTNFTPGGSEYVRTYTITVDNPTGQVWGVRLYGTPKKLDGATRDKNGWLAVTEMQVSGESSISQAIDLSVNLAQGQTAIWSHDTQKDRPETLTDGDVTTYDATHGGDVGTVGEYNWAGVLFDTAKSGVGAVGIIQKMFKDGGWLDPETMVVEYTTDTNLVMTTDGSGTLDPSTPGTWTAVTGLDMGRWADMEDELGALEGYVRASDSTWQERRRINQSEILMFDTIDEAITGIRVRGTTWDEWNEDLGTTFTADDPNGFLSMTEFEVFAAEVPEPSSLMLLVVMAGFGLFRRAKR